ncbi:hypothetical protein QYM36_008872, partial [Artemia franciscana]
GGIIAKSIFTNSSFESNHVNTIITLATPHEDPIIPVDYALRRFYSKFATHYSSKAKNLNGLIVASIGGGLRDFQVRSGLTHTDIDGLSVLTTDIPGVWLETDHLCIVWCKEVVLTLVRSLFDLVDPKTRQIYVESRKRRETLEYHLLKASKNKWRNGGKSIKNRPSERKVQFDNNARWREVIMRQMTLRAPEGNTEYYMFQAGENPRHNLLTAIAYYWDAEDWVFACFPSSYKLSVRYCESGKSLTYLTTLLPHSGKMVTLDLAKVYKSGYTHVVFVVPQRLSRKAWLDIDIYAESERHRKIDFTTPIPTTRVGLPIDQGSVMNVYDLVGLDKAWQSFDLTIETSCSGETRRAGFIWFAPPWSNEGVTEALRRNASRTLALQLHRPKPKDRPTLETPKLYFATNPQCNYLVTLKLNIFGVFSQLLRFYGPLIPGVCAAVLLEVLRLQLNSPKDVVPSYFTTILNISLVRLLLLPKLLGTILGLLVRKAVPSEMIVDFAFDAVSKFPFVVSGVLIAMAYGGCGTLALYCGFIFHFVKMFKAYQSLLQNRVKGVTYKVLRVERIAGAEHVGETISEDRKMINFQTTIGLLWFISCCLNTPVLMHWWKYKPSNNDVLSKLLYLARQDSIAQQVSDDNENPEVDIDVNVYDEGEPRNDHADFEEETRKEGNE